MSLTNKYCCMLLHAEWLSYLNGHSRAGVFPPTALKQAPLTGDIHMSQVLYIENGKMIRLIFCKAINPQCNRQKRKMLATYMMIHVTYSSLQNKNIINISKLV